MRDKKYKQSKEKTLKVVKKEKKKANLSARQIYWSNVINNPEV